MRSSRLVTVLSEPWVLAVLLGAGLIEVALRLRSTSVAGPAAVGAILGAALLLAPRALATWWQPLVIAVAAVLLLRGRSSFTALAVGLGVGLVAGIA
jgi:hypothetical protein